MKTEHINLVQVSEPAYQWLKAKYIAVDDRDAEAYRSFLAEDCQLAFGNNPAIKGADKIIESLIKFWETINGLNHHFINIFGLEHQLAAEAIIDYTRKDNTVVAIPCVTTIERSANGKAVFIRIYIDTAPIFHLNA